MAVQAQGWLDAVVGSQRIRLECVLSVTRIMHACHAYLNHACVPFKYAHQNRLAALRRRSSDHYFTASQVRTILLEICACAEGSGGIIRGKGKGNGRGRLKKGDIACDGRDEQQKSASNMLTPLNEQRILAFLILYERVSGYLTNYV